jgi:hypothetical protein
MLGHFLGQHIEDFQAESRLGLASTVPLAKGAFAVVGGTARARFGLDGGSLVTGVEGQSCQVGAQGCPLSRHVWRVSPGQNQAEGYELASWRALAAVEPVGTPAGLRLLVAGGVDQVPEGSANRLGDALLCQVESGAVICIDSKAKMVATRARAAHTCLESGTKGCTKVLLLGGVKAGAILAEIYDAATDSFSVPKVSNAPASLHGGELVRSGTAWYLVGASTRAHYLEDRKAPAAADLKPLRVVVDLESEPVSVTVSEVNMNAAGEGGQRLFSTSVILYDGSVLVLGGLDGTGNEAAQALRLGTDGSALAGIPLVQPRFLAGAGTLSGGPLTGCVLLAGGAARVGGSLSALNHVEVFCP